MASVLILSRLLKQANIRFQMVNFGNSLKMAVMHVTNFGQLRVGNGDRSVITSGQYSGNVLVLKDFTNTIYV